MYIKVSVSVYDSKRVAFVGPFESAEARDKAVATWGKKYRVGILESVEAPTDGARTYAPDDKKGVEEVFTEVYFQLWK